MFWKVCLMSNNKKEKPRHLGRGLQSLLGPITFLAPDSSNAIPITEIGPKYPPDKELQDSLRDLPLDSIKPNPYQPRTIWNEDELTDLADSIRSNGIIQPIVVRTNIHAGYDLIAGERRFRAAKIVGLKTIPALVRKATDEQMLEIALVENIHRTDLNPIERAKAYKKYIATFSLTQEQASERLGENRSVVANYLRLLDLPPDIRQMLIERNLSMGHARAILSLPDDELRRKFANRAMAGRLSVREVERLVRKYINKPGTEKGRLGQQVKAPHIIDLERKLTSQMGTKVSIETRKGGQRGKIIIEFYSLDDFDRIVERMALTAAEEV